MITQQPDGHRFALCGLTVRNNIAFAKDGLCPGCIIEKEMAERQKKLSCVRGLAGSKRRQMDVVYATSLGWFPRTCLSDASSLIKAPNRGQQKISFYQSGLAKT